MQSTVKLLKLLPVCTGFLFHFSVVAMSFMWFIHLAYVAILFKFPFFGRTLVKKARLVHAVSVPTVLLLCLIGPTVTLLWCGYFTARFPSIFCLPSNMDVLFYSIAAPLNILAVLTVAVTLGAVWEIHKVCVCAGVTYIYNAQHMHVHIHKHTIVHTTYVQALKCPKCYYSKIY